jgi:UDP-glucose 4-epimerase
LIESQKAVGEVYNIGANEEVTILELAERVKSLTGSDSRIVFVPYDQAYEEGFEDMLRRVPDLSKIHKLIDYQPTLDLDEILKSVIDYQRSELAV